MVWGRSETLWKPSFRGFETLWKPFGNALKPFGNPFEALWNSLECRICWKPLRKLMFWILFENPIWKCWGKNILLVCVRWHMRDSTACYLNFFLQKCYFAAWLGTDLFIVVGRSKDIAHVKLLLSLVAKIADICECGPGRSVLVYDAFEVHVTDRVKVLLKWERLT